MIKVDDKFELDIRHVAVYTPYTRDEAIYIYAMATYTFMNVDLSDVKPFPHYRQ